MNWDEGQHLHPDERFLTQVEASLRWPQQGFLGAYFDEAKSTLNPRNVGFTFFAYGDFPIMLVKGASTALGRADYAQVYLVGRVMAALVDLGTLLVLFLLARLLYRDDRVALLAAAFYALSALAIQQAHFFVVDNFSAFFGLVALLFTARMAKYGLPRDWLFAGIGIGLALASKLSVYPLAFLPVVVAVYRIALAWRTAGISRGAAFERTAFRLILCGAAAALTFRLCEPYAFADFGLAPRWLANVREASEWVSGVRDAPFGHQWAGRTPLLFPLENMVGWGMGLPLGIAAWLGWLLAAWYLLRRGMVAHLIPVAWTGIFFAILGSAWVTSLRYFLPIYPTLALLGAWALIHLYDRAAVAGGARTASDSRAIALIAARALLGLVLVTTAAYAIGFAGIYTRPNTRIEASRWIYANLPPGVTIANETPFDDALPLRVDGHDGFNGMYVSLSMQITAEDSPQKLLYMLGVLDRADYLIISSNRQYGSMPRLPTRFPLVIRYYEALFAGRLGFERVGEYTSYPSIFGIPLPDQGAEEAWTVYDHPRVQIFHKTASYDPDKVAAILGAVDWSSIVVLTPKQASQASNALLLTPEEEQTARTGGTWRAIFDPDDLANRAPLLPWVLALLLLGIVGLPFVWSIGAALPDGGYALARPLGLLLVGWLAWLLASTHLLAFTRTSIALTLVLIGAIGAALVAPRWRAFVGWLRDRCALLLAEEAIFWGAFGALLLIRYANPDLWHPARGGEKPMDFAFLNAVIKSESFPPYDPWFADGTINYYYFGYVLVAAVIKLTGIVPAVAYNLAVPSLFALLATAIFGTALALIGGSQRPGARRRAAIFAGIATLFVTVSGNLAELLLILRGFRDLGARSFVSPVPGLAGLADMARGFGLALRGNQPLPIQPDWWYWNATRVIAHPTTEAGPITEFPAFTFLFADLHAHMIALPFTATAIGLALAHALASPDEPGWLARWGRVAALAFVVGGLRVINTWDFPTYALIGIAILAIQGWRRRGTSFARLFGIVGTSAFFLAFGYLCYLPFYRRYGLGPITPALWEGSRTALDAYLTIHGLFLFVIACALLADLALARDLNPVARLVRLGMRHPHRLLRLRRLHRLLVADTPLYRLARRAPLVALALIALVALAHQFVPALILALLGLTALVFVRRGHAGADKEAFLWQLALGLVALGLAITLAVEFVVPRGLDVGRVNTVYKFYVQVWVLWGLAAAAAAARLYGQLPRQRRPFRLWYYGFVTLFAATLLYPIFAIPARIGDRFGRVTTMTLDGMAFMQQAVTVENGQQVPLANDLLAIRWMQQNIPGSPVVAEVNTTPVLYGWQSRFAVYTGDPDPVGWDWHERQQRGLVPGNAVPNRVKDIQRAYATTDAGEAYRLFARYGVQYIVVGGLERAYYPAGQAKWEGARGSLWNLAYANAGVQIYRVITPAAPTAGAR